MKQQLLVMTAAISLAFSAATSAQSTPSSPAPQKSAAQQCKDLTGTALDACLKSAQSAASGSGAAPGKEKSGTDATGGTSGGASGKGAGQSY